MQDDKKLICIGIITSAHGIRGAVKIKSFAQNPADIAGYSPLYSADGKIKYTIKVLSTNNDVLIAEVNDIKNRNEAELLGSTELYVYRNMLPEAEENQFYYEDLVGLEALHVKDGQPIGRVSAIYNHGAGDIIEVELTNGKTELFIFNKETVPEVNISGGYLKINFPKIDFIPNNDN